MIRELRRLRDDESGFSIVFISLGFLGFLSATMLAIDVGMLMTARNQAQNAADAGALAGATALAFNNFNDHSANGPAVQSAINTAKANSVIGQAPSVIPADVEFPQDPATGQFNLSPALERNRFRVDALFSYQPTPGTVFFAGYSSILTEPSGLRFDGLRRSTDGFYVKASYLFRL